MPINLGSSLLGDVYLGPTQVQKMYLGSNLVYNNTAQATQFAARNISQSSFAGVFDPSVTGYSGNPNNNLIDNNFYRAKNRDNTLGVEFLAGSNTEQPGFIPKSGGGVYGVCASRLAIISTAGNYRDEFRPQIPASGTDFTSYDDWATINPNRERTYSFYVKIPAGFNYMSEGIGGVGSLDNKYFRIFTQFHPGEDGNNNQGQTPTFDLGFGNVGNDGVNDSEDGIKIYVVEKLLDKYIAGNPVRLLVDDVKTNFELDQWLHIIVKANWGTWADTDTNPSGYFRVGYRWIDPSSPSNPSFTFPSACQFENTHTFATAENRVDRQITYLSQGDYNQYGIVAANDVFNSNFGITIGGARQSVTYFTGLEILDHTSDSTVVDVNGQNVSISAMTDTQKNEYMRLKTVSS